MLPCHALELLHGSVDWMCGAAMYLGRAPLWGLHAFLTVTLVGSNRLWAHRLQRELPACGRQSSASHRGGACARASSSMLARGLFFRLSAP